MFEAKRCKSLYSNRQLPSASPWTYLTKIEKSDMLYHDTDKSVKDHLTHLVTSILDKISENQRQNGRK